MAPNRRIVGLDAWRAALLLGGPVVHAAGFAKRLYPEHMPVWTMVEWTSHLFRMQAFFFISGLVSSFAAGQRHDWLRWRLVQLGLPLVAVWVTILIPIEAFAGSGAVATTRFRDPLHLWFLCVLLVATIVARVGHQFLRKHLYDVVGSRSLPFFLALWIASSVALACYSETLSREAGNKELLLLALSSTPYYTLYYLAGAVLANCPALLAQVERSRLLPLGFVTGTGAVVLFPYRPSVFLASSDKFLGQCLDGAIVSVTSVLICVCVADTALRMRRIPALVRRFSQASFTVYLLHFPVIELLCLLPGVTRMNPILWFVSVAYTSLTLSLVAHKEFSRFAIFRIFYNGKIEVRIRPALDAQHVVGRRWRHGGSTLEKAHRRRHHSHAGKRIQLLSRANRSE